MQSWIALVIIAALAGGSLWLRVRAYRAAELEDVTSSKPSPLSMAIQDLLAAAGGIYLSLVMMVSFLKLDIPDRMHLMIVSVDPLAISSLMLAIVQPYVLRLFHKD